MTAQPIPRETLASSFDQAGTLQMARDACDALGYDSADIPEKVLKDGVDLVGRCNGFVVQGNETVFDVAKAEPTPITLRQFFNADLADRRFLRQRLPANLPELLGLPTPPVAQP